MNAFEQKNWKMKFELNLNYELNKKRKKDLIS